MKKPDIAKQLARRAKVSPAEAADRLDGVVSQILADLKEGRETRLPGLGRLRQGRDGKVSFQAEGNRHD